MAAARFQMGMPRAEPGGHGPQLSSLRSGATSNAGKTNTASAVIRILNNHVCYVPKDYTNYRSRFLFLPLPHCGIAVGDPRERIDAEVMHSAPPAQRAYYD